MDGARSGLGSAKSGEDGIWDGRSLGWTGPGMDGAGGQGLSLYEYVV